MYNTNNNFAMQEGSIQHQWMEQVVPSHGPDGPKGAARILDMHPETLRSRIKKYGLKRPDPSE